jgi:hypothetical protein
MQLAGYTLQQVLTLIDNGTAAQATMPTGNMAYFWTGQAANSVRSTDEINTNSNFAGVIAGQCYYNAGGSVPSGCVSNGGSDYPSGLTGLLVLEGGWGSATLPGLSTNSYIPGAVVDTLDSLSGQLLPEISFEGSILSFIQYGATASYGSAFEPTNIQSRFPIASQFMNYYFGGATIGEAYIKSVQDPGLANLVGDPLARPFGTTAAFASGTLTIKTSIMQPGSTYSLKAASTCGGTYSTLQSGLSVGSKLNYKTITDSSGFHSFYQITSP